MKKRILSIAFAALLTIGLATAANANPCVAFRIYCGEELRAFGYVCGPTLEAIVQTLLRMAEGACKV